MCNKRVTRGPAPTLLMTTAHRPQSIEIFFENGHVGNQLGVILDH